MEVKLTYYEASDTVPFLGQQVWVSVYIEQLRKEYQFLSSQCRESYYANTISAQRTIYLRKVVTHQVM